MVVIARARGALAGSWRSNRPLTALGVAMVILLAATLAGMALDSRVVTGVDAWLKPSKFALSVAIYAFTLVWMLSLVRARPRLVRAVSAITAVGLGLELALIVLQAARATTSHFDVATPLSSAIWTTMAIAIVAVWITTLVIEGLLVLQRFDDPVLGWGVRLGVLVALTGMGIAFLMTSPTPDQLAAIRTGHPTGIIGAHTVGLPDGGPGLPLLNWSTAGGDLRVPHFVGLHGLQALPLAAWLVSRLASGLGLARYAAIALVWTVAAAYLGLLAILTWQAERGQPVIAPDAATMTALGALLAAAVVAAVTVVAVGRAARPTVAPA